MKSEQPLIVGSARGTTLLEMLVATTIMVTLASIISLSYEGMREKAEKIGCMSNLRVLYLAFDSHVKDHGSWPQEPADVKEGGAEFYRWMVKAVLPYGGERQAWMCPTEYRQRLQNQTQDDFIGSYVPTQFSPGTETPWRWATQPWLIERGNNHRDEALCILPNGATLTVREAITQY